MKLQLVLLAALCAALADSGAAVPAKHDKAPAPNPIPPIWRKLAKLPREERAAMVRSLMFSRSALEDQVVNLIYTVATSPALNPLLVPLVTIDINNEAVVMTGTMDTISVVGLSGLSVDLLTINPLSLKGTFGFTLPSLDVTGNYDIDGVIGNLLPVYGTGPFQVLATNLKIAGSVQMGTTLQGFVYIKSLVLDLGLESFFVNFEMLLGSQELSDVVNEMINDLGMDFLRRHELAIETAVAAAITNKFNSRGGQMTLEQFVDVISGGAATLRECQS